MLHQQITYRDAAPSDAAALLDYLKAVGGESDNLSFGAEGIPLTAEQEARLLESFAGNPVSRMILALDGDRIIGCGVVDGNANPRFRHRRNLAISVLRDYWGQQIGSALMGRMISFANSSGAQVLSLEVRSDNERAKALYHKFGFVRYGTFSKYFNIHGQYFDADFMHCDMTKKHTSEKE